MGYTTIELTQKYTLVGVNFTGLADSKEVPISELLSGGFENGDRLQLPLEGNSAYDVVEWKDGAWRRLGTDLIVNPVVTQGSGFWIVTPNVSKETPVQVCVKGAVKISEELTLAVGQGYRITSAGFPVDLAVNGSAFTWENINDGDLLQIPLEGNAYDVLEWNKGQWCRSGTDVVADKVIPQDSAVWLVSTNTKAHVTVSVK